MYLDIAFTYVLDVESWDAKGYTIGQLAYRFVTLICYHMDLIPG